MPALRIVDRYLFRQMVGGYLLVVVALVTIMSLENVSRLTAAIIDTDSPVLLLVRLMSTLVPEYLGIAIPVATYLATAMAVRRLSLAGEWQIFEATGLSPARMMMMPMTLALLSAGAQLTIRLDVQPVGERTLDRLLSEVRRGLHGMTFKPGEIVAVDALTTVFAERPADAAPGTLANVIIRHRKDVATAERATVTRDVAGGIGFTLWNGTLVEHRSDGHFRTLTFARYSMNLPAAQAAARHRSAADRNDRLRLAELLPLVRAEAGTHGVAEPATAALLARLQSAAFCLMLPWFGFAFGVPPKRQAGGAALLLGVILIVINLRSTAFVERNLSTIPILSALAHQALWAAITVAVFKGSRHFGPGWIDEALARGAQRLVALLRIPRHALGMDRDGVTIAGRPAPHRS